MVKDLVEELIEPQDKPLSSSLEDYLEAIYWVCREHKVARVGQISEKLGVGKSSVTAALKVLSEKGLVHYDPYQFISLTKPGAKLALDIVWRHDVLKRFFVEILGVDDQLAGETACKMEHHIDREVLDRLLRFVQKTSTGAVNDEPGIDG
jgi:DtxR family Mn-dependent transcriptional regulator